MDQIDAKLIMLLQQNARVSLKELAKEVFLTTPAVSARIEKLEKRESLPDTVQRSIRLSLVITLQPLSTWNYSRHRKKYFILLLKKSQMLSNVIVSPAPIPC